MEAAVTFEILVHIKQSTGHHILEDRNSNTNRKLGRIMMMRVFYFFLKTNCILLSPQIQITAGWILSIVAMLGSLDGIYSFYQPDAEKTVLESAFYNGLFRNVWAFGVGVTIFLCVTGYGGKVP
jgi:hypothetical protein